MAERMCEVLVNRVTGEVSAVIRGGDQEVARISWTLGELVSKDPELAMDMITSRFREWARAYHTTNLRIHIEPE